MTQTTQIEISDQYFDSIFSNLENSETPVAQGLVKSTVHKFSFTPALENNTLSDDNRTLEKTELEEILKTFYRTQGKSYASQLWTDLISRISPDGKIDTDKEKADFLNTIQDEKIHINSGGPVVTLTTGDIKVDLQLDKPYFNTKDDLKNALAKIYDDAEKSGSLAGSNTVTGAIEDFDGTTYSVNTFLLGITDVSVLTTVDYQEDGDKIISRNSLYTGTNPFGPDIYKTSGLINIESTSGGWTYSKADQKLHYEQKSKVTVGDIDFTGLTKSKAPQAALQVIYGVLSGGPKMIGTKMIILLNGEYKVITL